ncbi:uncharacterized protein LOC119694435 [Plutella xylostella]|uniref:uncharacterized protein LOC119694435 n=1 Tax=Plutella xylostella TaxID=51655 RepID=UPI002032788D|nr:uncharacterized protein LOC119694435 [Plutella xylostella]
MDNKKNKASKKGTRRTVFGIKLPPIEPCDDNEVIKTTLDIDPAFYSMIDGRPIRPNTSLNAYKQNIRDIAVKRTLHGFVTDEIIRIDREIESERYIYEKALAHFEDYKNSFDKFLADDNNKTIAVMTKSDTMTKDLTNLTEDQKQVSYELASIKSKLQYVDQNFMILLSFENFLHKASPILWQDSHNITLELKHEEILTINNDILLEIDKALIIKKLNKFPPPRLYFETPEQLLIIFQLLEKQNLNYLLVTEELSVQKNKFIKALDGIKTLLRQELNFIQQKINESEDIIKWNEMREVELKEIFFRILEEKIKYLVSSETALKIYNYVEYAYEQLIAPNDTDLSTLDMTKALEAEYNNLMLDLSVFDLDELKKIEKETYEQEAEALHKAKIASKLLKDVDKLSKRMNSSYQPASKE